MSLLLWMGMEDGQKKTISKKKLATNTGFRIVFHYAKSLRDLDYKLNEISFYVFSAENWRRNPSEIKNLFNLITEFYRDFSSTANDNNLKIRHYGSRKKLSKKLLSIIDEVTSITKDNKGTIVNLLFNYGSRQEMNDAVDKIKKLKNPSKNLRDYFYIPESKDPDFIIRTGGQIRLSNFMLWQSAYAELYFTKVLWPDFKISNLNRALDQLIKRKRNYGQ
ncbi:MAG: isoprenyl transferase [Candidatus Pelagibacterales bacterium]|nr:MAG: isoprenyl transferase [Pelagibacterales bacterium]